MSSNNPKTSQFWLGRMEKAFAEQEKLYQRKQVLLTRFGATTVTIGGSERFAHLRFCSDNSEAELIRINQKLKQLKKTKLPYYWKQLVRLKKE